MEIDGGPSVSDVSTIRVTNGSLNDDGGGQVTLTIGLGDVVGPGSSTDNAITRFDSTTGKLLQNSTVIVDDSGNISGVGTISSGAITSTGSSSFATLTSTHLTTSDFKSGYVSKTTNYTATTSDYFIACDSSGGSFTITLPTAASIAGFHLYVKKIDSSGNTVTIDGNSSETIDGAATKIINTQYETIGIISNGASWYII